MRELLACALHMSVESRSPHVRWIPIHPLTIKLAKSGNRRNHASWFLTICWTSCIVILHLLVARFEIARSICCRANNRWCFRKYRAKNHVFSLALLFPDTSASRCRSRGNVNEEVIVRNVSRLKLGKLLPPSFSPFYSCPSSITSQCIRSRPMWINVRSDCWYDIIWSAHITIAWKKLSFDRMRCVVKYSTLWTRIRFTKINSKSTYIFNLYRVSLINVEVITNYVISWFITADYEQWNIL